MNHAAGWLILVFVGVVTAAQGADLLDAPVAGITRVEIQKAFFAIMDKLEGEDRRAFASAFTVLDSRFNRRFPDAVTQTEKDEVYVALVKGRTPRDVIILGSLLQLADLREHRAAGEEAPDFPAIESWAIDDLRNYSRQANKAVDPTPGAAPRESGGTSED